MQGRPPGHFLGGSAMTCSWPLGESTGTSRKCGNRKQVGCVDAAP